MKYLTWKFGFFIGYYHSVIVLNRKRVNPLYDAMTQSVPSIYNKTKGSKDAKLWKQVRCLKCALVVLFVFCCASMAVSIFTVITYMGSKGMYLSL